MKIIYFLCLLLMVGFHANSQVRTSTLQGEPSKLVKFYPNPAVTQITFDFEVGYDKNYSFQIFNFAGKKVLEVFSITPKLIINVNDFYRGVYIFQVKDRSGKIIRSGKFDVAR